MPFNTAQNLFTSASFSPILIPKKVLKASRYGFNGKMKDNEVEGEGDIYDYGARMLDVRLGRWLSEDAHFGKYPAITPFGFSLNSPLLFYDLDGKDAVVTVQKNENGGGSIIISSTIYITGAGANEFNAKEFTNQAEKMYKNGLYIDENGNKFDISFKVDFKYVEDKSKIKLQDGENILEYNRNEIISEVPCKTITQTETSAKDGVTSIKVEITQTAGKSGEIGKADNVGKSYKATLHEALHLLGLSDRYSEGKGKSGERVTTPHQGFENDPMGSYEGKELNQIHYNNYGKAFANKEAGKYILKNKIDINPNNGKLNGAATKKDEAKK